MDSEYTIQRRDDGIIEIRFSAPAFDDSSEGNEESTAVAERIMVEQSLRRDLVIDWRDDTTLWLHTDMDEDPKEEEFRLPQRTEAQQDAYDEGLCMAVNRLSMVPEIQNAILAAMPIDFHIPDQESNNVTKGDMVWWALWSIAQDPDPEEGPTDQHSSLGPG